MRLQVGPRPAAAIVAGNVRDPLLDAAGIVRQRERKGHVAQEELASRPQHGRDVEEGDAFPEICQVVERVGRDNMVSAG